MLDHLDDIMLMTATSTPKPASQQSHNGSFCLRFKATASVTFKSIMHEVRPGLAPVWMSSLYGQAVCRLNIIKPYVQICILMCI
jgi:hypothetical protein